MSPDRSKDSPANPGDSRRSRCPPRRLQHRRRWFACPTRPEPGFWSCPTVGTTSDLTVWYRWPVPDSPAPRKQHSDFSCIGRWLQGRERPADYRRGKGSVAARAAWLVLTRDGTAAHPEILRELWTGDISIHYLLAAVRSVVSVVRARSSEAAAKKQAERSSSILLLFHEYEDASGNAIPNPKSRRCC